MSKTVTATLQVSFTKEDEAGVDQGAVLTLEIDDRPDGLNAGDTSFRPGDPVFYLMYLAGASLSQHFATSGVISPAGTGAKPVGTDTDPERITFEESREVGLRYPAGGGLTSYEWLGTVFGLDGNPTTAPVPEVVDNGATLRLPEKITGILEISYMAPYTAYQLNGVPLDMPQSMIFAQAVTG